MDLNISITAAACEYIKQKVDKDHGAGFRLSIKKTGCSGYSYLPEIVGEKNPEDLTFETINGVTVFVDSKWVDLLKGVKVDYQEEVKAGLKQRRLIFTNPNESSRCGCGESFHIE
jgi:iron-sulfur cluster assembly protein